MLVSLHCASLKSVVIIIVMEELTMNEDIIKGKWNEIKGKLKEQWGKLTDDEVKQIQGNYQQLAGMLQQKYGYQKEQIEKEVNSFLKKNNFK